MQPCTQEILEGKGRDGCSKVFPSASVGRSEGRKEGKSSIPSETASSFLDPSSERERRNCGGGAAE